MDSWRIQVNSQDLSVVPPTSQGEVGAMVIRASKGSATPVYFDKGQENRLITWFGTPSATSPEVYEAIQYNKVAPIWVAAPPATTDTLGGVMVTSVGTTSVPMSAGVTPSAWAAGITIATVTDYFAVVATSPVATDDMAAKVSYNTVTDIWTMEVFRADNLGVYSSVESNDFSLVPGYVDGFGRNIYAGEVFKGNDYVQVQVNASYTLATPTPFINDATYVKFDGGARSANSAITDAVLNASWDFFKQKNNYPADIFMDPTGKTAIAAKFDDLAETYQKYSYYILATPDNTLAATTIVNKKALGIDNPNLAFYCNWGRVKDTWNKSDFWTSLIGRVGIKHAQMADVFDGLAPSYIDENGHGGQLGSGILELRYEYTDTEQQAFDEAGINPLIFDKFYGVMVVGQRTAQNPNYLSDYSWVAHTRLFNYIKRNVVDKVLTYQITKLNDTNHRFLAQTGVENILKPILTQQLLADAKVVCNGKNNPASILSQRKFVLSLAVKVTPFSETIQFNFINVGQSTDVATVI